MIALVFKKLRPGEMKHREDEVHMRPEGFKANVHDHGQSTSTIHPASRPLCPDPMHQSPQVGLLISVEGPTASVEGPRNPDVILKSPDSPL